MRIAFWRKPSLQELSERIEERRFGNRPPDAGEPELLMWIGGDPSVEPALTATLRQLAVARPDGPIAFLIDNPSLAENARPLLREFSSRRELVASQRTDLPALLYGRALATSAHAWCGFSWPGCDFSADALAVLKDGATKTTSDLVQGDLVPPVPREVAPLAQRGWLEMTDLVPMHHALVRTAAVRSNGGLVAEPLLQRTFWWELTLRLSRLGAFAYTPSPAPAQRWNWNTYPLSGEDATTSDIAARFTVRPDRDVAGFLNDLPPVVAADVDQRLSSWSVSHKIQAPEFQLQRREEPRPFPIRVTIVAESIDVENSELVFYSYFVRLQGKRKVTWRAVTYEACRPEDVASCDLLILTRPRFPEVPAILDACDKFGVPLLVMIDDNWVAAGRDYPRYERLFTPGKPPFEIFRDSLRRADAVHVLSARTGEDIASDASRLVYMPPNVDFSRWGGAQKRSHGDRVLVCYAGTPRWDASGFRALHELMTTDERCDALIMAHEIPPELRSLPPSRLTFVPWQADLNRYLRTLVEIGPDIMLAPLDDTRFTSSKVPVKLFDAAACGAAGIFSDVTLYREIVREGETGLLVENTDEAWLKAMRKLAGDAELRRRIAANALQYVESHYSTDRLVDRFVAMFEDVCLNARRKRR